MSLASLKLDCSSCPVTGLKWGAQPKPLLHPHRVPNVLLPFQPRAASSSSLTLTANESPSRIESLGQVSGVLGCQWGDEGKGKLVDVLAQHFDIVARCQVGIFRGEALEKCFLKTSFSTLLVVLFQIAVFECFCGKLIAHMLLIKKKKK